MALAGALAQCVAWATQLASVRRSAQATSHPGNGISDHTIERAAWGETTTAHFRYVRRRARYQVQCEVNYQIDGRRGKGTVVDMSCEGWRVKSADCVPVGTVMSLTICLPGNDLPFLLSRAIVRWSDRGASGISLVTFDARPAAQISEFYSTLPRAHRQESAPHKPEWYIVPGCDA